jgi:hypothetical protein
MSDPHPVPNPAAADIPRYYGLLYVDRRHDQHVNLRTRRDPVTVYVGCASLLAASARAAGESFAVLTNAAAELRSIADSCGFPSFDCVEMPFDLALPPGTRFFHAHHKLCVLEAMGSGALGSFVGLVDIDAVMQGPLSDRLGRAPGLHAYPMDAGFAGAGAGDLDLLIGQARARRQWYGGEFIAGDWKSMRRLAETCRALLPRYLQVLRQLRHVGEETIVSAALNLLEEEGAPIRDVGADRIVARWYSSRLPVVQAPLARALDALVLHLPTDKTFLQSHARKPFSADRFQAALLRRALRKSILRSLANPILGLAESEPKFAPRVWERRTASPPGARLFHRKDHEAAA